MGITLSCNIASNPNSLFSFQTFHAQTRPTQYINPATIKAAGEGNNGCRKCGGVVFDLERIASSKGFVYHRQCLNCDGCKARLDSGLAQPYEAPEGQGGCVFCKRCFVERFGEGGKPLTLSDTAVIPATDGSGENVNIGLAFYVRFKSRGFET